MTTNEGVTIQKDEQSTTSYSPIKNLVNHLSNHANVKKVYGEVVEIDGKKVIPAAKVKYMFGGGGGEGTKDSTEGGKGEGGGGYCSIQPLGVYEIASKKTKFIPTIDIKFILTIAAFLTALLSILLKRK